MNAVNLIERQPSTSSLSSSLIHMDSIENDNDKFNQWIRLTSDEIRLLGKINNLELKFVVFFFSY